MKFITNLLETLLSETLLPWVLLAVFFAVGAAVGGTAVKWRKDRDIAVIQQAHAEEKAAAASDALARLQTAQRRGDELAAQVAAADAARLQLGEEKDREIKRLTTGRACLGAGVVRLLNRDQGSGIRDQLSAPTGYAALADPPFAPDSDDGRQMTEDSQSEDGGQKTEDSQSGAAAPSWGLQTAQSAANRQSSVLSPL
ncbi:MAG: hypothetical protein LBQ81_09650, partial [Zoogloeaceae bacterium]|nr:hypothetical protein [Zoogloeaceae bacterium]